MPRARALSLLLPLALALAAACDSRRDAALPAERAASLLTDRNWLDRWPTGPREQLHVYRFTPSMGGGVFQDRTLFAGHFELFVFAVSGDRLNIGWPDRDLAEDIAFRITPVDGPEPFDLRLDLEGNAVGPHTLYGRRAEGSGDARLVEVERKLSAAAPASPPAGRAP
jgi:hypothetical protein